MKLLLLTLGLGILTLTPNLSKAEELAATCIYKTGEVNEAVKSGEAPKELTINGLNSNGEYDSTGSVTISIVVTNFLSQPTATVMILGDDDQAQFVRLSAQNRTLEMSGSRGLGKYSLSCTVED